MSRSLRIQYAGAWYHVANRGAGRQRVFRNDNHRQLFLDLLGELLSRHGVETHAYCLMNNRYDLIVCTPAANLSLAMRHLNGIYTQRYNRLVGRDGSLFRGRYKAVVFEPESCLLAVSRHLHRRPLATGTVPRLDRYRWSSYPSYVTRRKNPAWLQQQAILSAVGDGEAVSRDYRRYVEQEEHPNPLVRAYYHGGSGSGSILGPDEFRAGLLQQFGTGDPEVPRRQLLPDQVSAERIVREVARHYEVSRREILTSARGRLNVPRLAAVWLCRHRAYMRLSEIAQFFGLAGYGSASAVLHRVRTQMRPPFWRQIKIIEQSLDTDRDDA